ncbi:MarR family transcriptional regulator [Natronolimnobius sp. AArcel1]|uniref:MarR family transcriptional regulator n=1 Tax=Natronolimnobius sp. AArcel1 TaxID=1679093 RepID=UPI0013EB44D6|nr:helix-turn-helix domain-containing protein [Natronolimnobius sp. AArcel1]NGM70293.1 MarR family transcriptional regulator [Natronolimnobius sp. AArcel1]
MPIDIETFERESEFDSGTTNAEQILSFLLSNDDKAFRRREIADTTDIDPNAVSAVLSRLKERDLVRHKPPYWAAGDQERIRSAVDFSRSLETLNDTLGSEDMDAWRAASADRSHPAEREDETE